ncbi:unnamed protein product [Staurois parvus]|uniref:Uncharacterized protein n=1 Tax=Staurois parvus TaxID=386267 RepID=A0ABN9H5M1_9NEOB|nr:unnamed protein product [Staurois parvus]
MLAVCILSVRDHPFTGAHLCASAGSLSAMSIHQHSWQQSLVTEGCFHTGMSSDSQLTGPLIHHAPKHGFSLSCLFSLHSV